MENTFRRNLQRGLGLSLAILLLSSVASYFSIYQLKRQSEWVNHTNVVLHQSEEILTLLNDAETGQRGYLLTRDDSYLAPYVAGVSSLYRNIDSLAKLTADNPSQQRRCSMLTKYVQQRLERLDDLIKLQNSGRQITPGQLKEGQFIMNRARAEIKAIQQEEQSLMVSRADKLEIFSWATPLILVITAFSAIFITINFYRRLMHDYDLRVTLQRRLEKDEEQTAGRIKIFEDVASRVSGGDYSISISDNEQDGLGKIAFAFNKMTAAVRESFTDFKDREWQKNGSAELSAKMIGEKNLAILSENIINQVAAYTNSQAAALYLFANDTLELTASYALDGGVEKSFKIGEGLVGQSAQDKKMIVLNEMPQESIVISYAAGEAKPQNLVVFPVCWEGNLKGVIETVSFEPYNERKVEWFETIADNIGLSIESAHQHTRLQQLLSETQAQAEELQMQQHELEHLNYDLENQAQKLQVSEEELKVQQEELLQANQELEERSSMLEEKNQMIVERNLEIQRKAEELEISTRYKSEFLANMSHELRTPLNSILLLSRLIAENTEDNLTKEQIEFANVIQSSGNNLLNLIDEILDLSKIEAGKMKVEFRDVSVKEITGNINSLFSPIAKDKNLVFNVTAEENAPAQMVTDSMRLEQILKNLISNAIKFTSKGSVSMIVKAAANEKIMFVVKDSGIGIAPDKQALIFEAFQQADGSTRRKFGGTGLGLSISRELAKLLGGEITVTSELNKGSEFTITIPVNASKAAEPEVEEPVAPPAPVLTVAEQVIQQASESMETAPAPANVFDDRDNIKPGEKIILIVEDDTIFAQTLLTFAHKYNYKGIIALQGDHGLELAKTFLPNAILLDIKLPVKDGWQVMDELKANNITRNIPVHMMSSLKVKEESLNRGAIDFIDKPATLDKLPDVFSKIEEALSMGPRKILIVEENEKHAQALCYFLESYNINVKGTQEIKEAIHVLLKDIADCVVLEMKVFADNAYEALMEVKNTAGLEHLPIIIFTGKSISKNEELRVKQVADSIVVKTANSYKRILDEIDLFLQIVEENDSDKQKISTRRLSALEQVLENKTVLIADDDVRNIYSLTKALETHKMHVISATDGKEALEQLKANPKVNVVLMDMMMPEMDGYEATQEIRKMSQYRNLPVLAVTAKAMYGDREKCIQAGASDYISKPIDIDQLISLLRVWLYQ